MQNVITIIGNHEAGSPFNEMEMNSVVDALQYNGGIVTDVKWLAEDTACDIYCEVLQAEEVRELLAHLLAEVAFDFIVQPPYNRRKKLLISDMDSTIIEQECIDELADFVGLKEQVAEITTRAMNGELDFKSALRERVALLGGLAESKLEEAFEQKITITPGAQELVATMKANGARTILVSGGFAFFTQRVKEATGFDFEEANILEIKDNALTGKVQEPILDKQAKLNSLLFHAEEVGIRTDDVLAVGDGANDLPMLQAAGLGVAYHAKPAVQQQTIARINHTSLKSLLYIQGYNEGEIAV